jgi:hypothetical protein
MKNVFCYSVVEFELYLQNHHTYEGKLQAGKS